ncbi:MAG: hypothetical protein OEZ59_04315, partial [Deltaproteobacteria bacterium]|nr:hypothetical protein [Deltaproteobacteria bacterium]
MRSVIKISVLLIAAVAMVAGSAFAQVSGSVSASFGRHTLTPDGGDAVTTWKGGHDIIMGIGAGEGALTGKTVLRYRDDGGAVCSGCTDENDKPLKNDHIPLKVRAGITWDLGAAKLNIHGKSLGALGFNTNADVANVRVAGGYKTTDNVIPHDNSGISGVFAAGPANVEVGLFAGCETCAGDKKADAQSIVLGVAGAAGAVKFNLGIYNGSATASCTDTHNGLGGGPDGFCENAWGENTLTPAYADEAVTDSNMMLGVGFDGGSFNVGFDYASNTVGAMGTGDPTTTTHIKLG